MKLYELNRLMEDQPYLAERINEFIKTGIINKQKGSEGEVRGHLEKASHNLNFIKDNIKLGYLDWAITGCYYASYHAALALTLTKSYFSKNHLATLCILIKEFYKRGLTKEDVELLNRFLDYHDVLFYVESKNKREEATYSTKRLFDKKEVETLRLKAVMFVNKIRDIIRGEARL